VVTVSSLAHHGGSEAVAAPEPGTGDSHRNYANAKLANLLFALELQRLAAAHGQALTSTAAHPGLAATGLVADREGLGRSPAVRLIAPLAVRVVTQSAVAGAGPVLYAATEAEPGSYSGPQRLRESRGPVGPARMAPLARDEDLAHRLWRLSEDLTGLHYPWPAQP
jgi:NAD(P)-dependent dehydrogenase (short-subunit alcohol dehydrogenase family)